MSPDPLLPDLSDVPVDEPTSSGKESAEPDEQEHSESSETGSDAESEHPAGGGVGGGTSPLLSAGP
jgi:hypothetical protein